VCVCVCVFSAACAVFAFQVTPLSCTL
jgi:hypothetical protein